MKYVVHPEIFRRFPGMRLAVAVASGIDNRTERPRITDRWRQVWMDAARAAAYGNAQSHPRVLPWRKWFRAMGVSGKEFPSSIEALLKRALKGGEPFRINPLVDFYNSVSLRNIVPAGGFDLGELHGPLELRLTKTGDRFIPLDAEVPEEIAPGEVVYTDGQNVLTRHFVWRQARAGLITPSTREVFLVSEVLGEVNGALAESVLTEFRSGLAEEFGAKSIGFLVDEKTSQISW